MGKLVMGYWDCPYCDSKGIRGDVAVCPSCGRARGDVKFYMKGHTEDQAREADERGGIEYVDEEKARFVNRGPDWYCSFCNSLNSDGAAFCTSCGASRESSEGNYFDMLKRKQEREASDAAPAPDARPEPQPAKPAGKKSPALFIGIAVILAVIIGLIVFMNGNTTRGDNTVTAVSWERIIAVEENVLCHESGWSVPEGGQITGQRREISSYRQVLDHYENVEVQRSRQVIDHYETWYSYQDMGNGYYEEIEHERPVYKTEYYTETESQPVYRQEPVYGTMYDYDIWRWKAARNVRAADEGHKAWWPDPALGTREREAGRSEAYRITVEAGEKKTRTTYRMKEADWLQINVGDSLFITARRSGADPYISDEKGEKLMDLMVDR